MVLVSCL
jgi:hypothetical protein